MRHRLLMLAIALSMGGVIPAADGKEVLSFAADSWCPFNCPQGNENEGFIVDIARAIYEPLDYRVEYHVMPWSRAILESRHGRLTGLFSAPKSEATEGFVFPRQHVGMMQNALFKRRDFQWKYAGLASLDATRIGFVQGYVFPGEIGQYLAKGAASKAGNIELATGDTAGQRNIRKLALGRVNLIAEDVSVVAYEHAAQHLKDEFEMAARIGAQVPIYIAFSPQRQNARELADILDAGISRLRASGELRKILAKYGLQDWEGGRR